MIGLEVLRKKIERKTIDLSDKLRDNLALDSIAKGQIIKSLKEFESFVLDSLEGCICISIKQLEGENEKAKQYLTKQKEKFGFNVTSNLGFWEGYLKRGKELLEESK